VTNAAVTLPGVAVSVLAGILENPQLELLSQVVALVTSAMTVYILSSLSRLLAARDYRGARTPIVVVIAGNIYVAVVNLLSGLLPAFDTATGIMTVVAIVPVGIAYIVMGIKVQNAAPLLPGPARGFSYTTIASGVCFASVLLLPLGLLTNIASDVLLAMVFFKASDAPLLGSQRDDRINA
jgi:hypothetical protein